MAKPNTTFNLDVKDLELIEWQNRKPDLLEFLRNKLQNFALTISWEVKVIEGTVKYYTNRDKFVRMAEKNPTLLELKKRLNLELE